MFQPQTTEPVLDLMKQDMVQSVVHDLRTPMTIIKGNLQLLISGVMGSMSAEQLMLLQRSVGPLEDLILLTDNLLQSITLQKTQVDLKLAAADLDQLLLETVDFYQIPFQQRKMRLFREGNTLGARILIDAFWFKRVLHNLIWNAFKFTPDQGHVTLHVDHKDGGMEIGVRDNGRGIPAERMEEIFEKFAQAAPRKDSKMGNGLGLWICRRVMELHGGRIRVESQEGRGSCFYLWLPSNKIL